MTCEPHRQFSGTPTDLWRMTNLLEAVAGFSEHFGLFRQPAGPHKVFDQDLSTEYRFPDLGTAW